LMFHYLKETYQQKGYSKVLIIDVRDTVFQADPFAKLFTGQSVFYAFEEGGDLTLDECKWNREWILDCFGEQVLKQVEQFRILCSGVSLASTDTALLYLKRMSDIVLGIAGVGFFPKCERNGVDQGIYNVLMYNDTIPNVTIVPDGNGTVVNMQNGATHFTSKYIASRSGRPVSIAHQYDRHSVVKDMILNQYNKSRSVIRVGGNVSLAANNTKNVPDMTGHCGKFLLSSNLDMFASGQCDLRGQSVAVDGINECCAHCIRTLNCTAFVLDTETCYLYTCVRNSEALDNWGGYSGLLVE